MPRPVPPEPAFESLRGKRRNTSLPRNSSHELRNIAQERKLGREIHQARSVRGQTCPKIYVPEGIVIEWAYAAFVIMREKLRFIGGHIDRNRTVAPASFTRQAQIQ